MNVNFYNCNSLSNMYRCINFCINVGSPLQCCNVDLEPQWTFFNCILTLRPPSVRIKYLLQISLAFFAFFRRSIHCANFLHCMAVTKQCKASLCVACSNPKLCFTIQCSATGALRSSLRSALCASQCLTPQLWTKITRPGRRLFWSPIDSI